MYYVYVLESLKNKRKYIGYTSKFPLYRLNEHNAGSNEYTRKNRPFELIYFEQYEDVEFTKKREKFFKSGNGRRVLKKILYIMAP